MPPRWGCGGIAVGDVDNDGRPDLYFTGGAVPNRLYRQVADLVFEEVTARAGVEGKGAWSTGASLVDIDNDGDLDIYVCNYDSANLLYLNEGKWHLRRKGAVLRLGLCRGGTYSGLL